MDKNELKSAMRAAASEEFSHIPPEESIQHTFSPNFQKKAQKLFRDTRHSWWPMVNTLSKRVALIAVGLVVVALAAVGTSALLHNPQSYVLTDHKDYVSIQDKSNPKSAIETVYTITEVPDGYTLADSDLDETAFHEIYRSEDGSELYYSQLVGEIGGAALDNDLGKLTQVTAGHREVILYVYEQPGIFLGIWFEDGYKFTLVHAGAMEEQTFLNIIASIDKAP